MLDIEIEDGFIDCPKYGVIGELRCMDSCKWFISREEDQVQCKHGEDTDTE